MNNAELFHFSYQRYLENQIRDIFGLDGTPVRFIIRNGEMAKMILALIISAIISYLLGSLNFGIIISKSLNKDDVRSHGSGNAGSTNMLRNYGKSTL